jgi:hypothetical protein
VKWNGESPAVRAAQKGVLEIEDGGRSLPTVALDPAQLSNGNILFTNSSGSVRFRLIVYPQPGVIVMQTIDWKDSKPAASSP